MDEPKVITKVMVPSSDLQIGQYVCELDRPWLDTPFLFQGFMLLTDEDIQAVKDICQFVYIDAERSLCKQPAVKPKRLQTGSFEKSLESAQINRKNTSRLLKSFVDEVKLGRGIDANAAKEVVAECVDSIVKNPDAMLLLARLKNRDAYTAEHSENVLVFSIALGRFIGLSLQDLRNLGFSALMHDMGKIQIPLEILNKPERLNPEEMQIMKKHAELGRDILMSCSNIYMGAIDVAHTHHEQIDGNGYPRGLRAEQLSPFSKIVSIADTYDAITSDRVYQLGRTHMEALGILQKAGGKQFDPHLAIRFIECLGIYPPGSVIEMSNGEVALVIQMNPKAKLKPKVVMLLDEFKKPQKHRIVDLSKLELDASSQAYRIAAMLRCDAYGLDLKGSESILDSILG